MNNSLIISVLLFALITSFYQGQGVYTSIEEANENPDKVKELVLSDLDTFPIDIFRYKNLQYLDIGNSSFHEIPKGLSNLKFLKEIVITHSPIKQLPCDIGNIKKLEKLSLIFTEINDIPPSVGNLYYLEELNLNGSPVSSLPDEFFKLTNLKVLYLQQEYPMESLMNQELQEKIMKHYPECTIWFDYSHIKK